VTRRAGAAAAAALVLVLGVVSGAIPTFIGGAPTGSSAPVAASHAPVPSTPRSYLEQSPSLDGAPTTQTRKSTVTLTGAVPAELAGKAGYGVRLYVTRPNAEPAAVRDAKIGSAALFTFRNIKLKPGRNSFTTTLLGPDGEGIPSSGVTYLLDTAVPNIIISSPAGGTTINHPTVDVAGKTQAGSLVTVSNAANHAQATATADAKGAFTINIAIALGANSLTIAATDPAGNAASAPLSLIGGKGRLTVDLTASAGRISAARLPATLVLTAVALDPDGIPLPGVSVLFTLTLPGLPPFTSETKVTDDAGRATFRAPVPAGTSLGVGAATAAISTGAYGDATTPIKIEVVP
jgi:hypothetical protein